MPRSVLKAAPTLIAGIVSLSFAQITLCADSSATDAAHAMPIEANFRGCETAGWCWFQFEPPQPLPDSLYRVRPDGVLRVPAREATSIAVRDRLNALLANMIHQAKHIELHDLRELEDGTFAARVTVTGVNVASDAILLELLESCSGRTQ